MNDAIDILVGEAHRRALKGVVRPVYRHGKRVGQVRDSDMLLMILLPRTTVSLSPIPCSPPSCTRRLLIPIDDPIPVGEQPGSGFVHPF
jgi:hypothetical protein